VRAENQTRVKYLEYARTKHMRRILTGSGQAVESCRRDQGLFTLFSRLRQDRFGMLVSAVQTRHAACAKG